METEQSRFKKTLENWAVPFSLVLALASALSQSIEILRGVGVVVFVIAAAILSGAWCFYVITQRKISIVDSTVKLPRFDMKTKVFSLILVAFALGVLVFQLIPKPEYKIPSFNLKISNISGRDVSMASAPEFFLSSPLTPLTQKQVGAGKIELVGFSNNSNGIAIQDENSIDCEANIIAPEVFRSAFERGDIEITMVWRVETTGQHIRVGPIPFTRESLTGKPMVFEVMPFVSKETQVDAAKKSIAENEGIVMVNLNNNQLEIDFSNNDDVTRKSLVACRESIQFLHKNYLPLNVLEFKNSPNIDDRAIAALRDLPVKDLRLAETSVNGGGFDMWMKNSKGEDSALFKSLEALHLQKCEGLKAHLKKLKKYQRLKLIVLSPNLEGEAKNQLGSEFEIAKKEKTYILLRRKSSAK